ncbi:TetR/AcrR family transcriptional regulator [Scatolibacter rhodanostii]|uniref:TetR/AcrR family transcriptional regulator n=1 Tax=Scatolibacter rhodanostii TaxID=2014781 RepID=UPI000C080187|nr:TetR/AcrR family transcriptional regulator [Scatolibacter rhodanostii]
MGRYVKHSELRYKLILDTAQQLFIEEGIKNVSFSVLAEACGIARATLYKYFPDKETLLWEIQRRSFQQFGESLRKQDSEQQLSALERYALYFDVMLQGFQVNPNNFLFFDLFSKTYQGETLKSESAIYERVFHDKDFGTHDTARFLQKNFHDGSLKPTLDAELTAVSAVYSSIYLLVGLSKDNMSIAIKYGMPPQDMARFIFDSFLIRISSDGSIPCYSKSSDKTL